MGDYCCPKCTRPLQVSSRRCRSWGGGTSSSVGAALAWGTPMGNNQVATSESFYRRNRGEGQFSKNERWGRVLILHHIHKYFEARSGQQQWEQDDRRGLVTIRKRQEYSCERIFKAVLVQMDIQGPRLSCFVFILVPSRETLPPRSREAGLLI